MERSKVYELIDEERERQRKKWARLHAHGVGDCSSAQVSLHTKLVVLVEEVGEVARALLEFDWPSLKRELVHVAAVAVAWLEGMDE